MDDGKKNPIGWYFGMNKIIIKLIFSFVLFISIASAVEVSASSEKTELDILNMEDIQSTNLSNPNIVLSVQDLTTEAPCQAHGV